MLRTIFRDRIALVALVLLVAFWAGYVWQASTGLTVGTRWSLGRNATEAQTSVALQKTMFVTFVAGTVLIWRIIRDRRD